MRLLSFVSRTISISLFSLCTGSSLNVLGLVNFSVLLILLSLFTFFFCYVTMLSHNCWVLLSLLVREGERVGEAEEGAEGEEEEARASEKVVGSGVDIGGKGESEE